MVSTTTNVFVAHDGPARPVQTSLDRCATALCAKTGAYAWSPLTETIIHVFAQRDTLVEIVKIYFIHAVLSRAETEVPATTGRRQTHYLNTTAHVKMVCYFTSMVK